MSRYRKIHVKMWSSADFLALSKPAPNGQTLFQYLLTGDHTSAIPGVLCVGRAALAEALGWSLEDWQSCFDELVRRGMAVADWDARLVYLPAALAHNEPTNPNVVRSWRNEWQMVRPCALRERIVADITRTLGSMKKPGFSDAWSDVLSNVPGNVPGNNRAIVPPNVPGNNRAERSQEQPQEQSVERSVEQSTEQPSDQSQEQPSDQSQERSPRVCARARSAPAPVPVLSEGVQGGPVLSELGEQILDAAARLPRIASVVDPAFASELALIATRAGKPHLVAKAFEEADGTLAARQGVQTTASVRDLLQRFVRSVRADRGDDRDAGRAERQQPTEPYVHRSVLPLVAPIRKPRAEAATFDLLTTATSVTT